MKTVVFKAKHGMRAGQRIQRGDKLELDDAQADRLVQLGLAELPPSEPASTSPSGAAPPEAAVTSPAAGGPAPAVTSAPAPADAAPVNAAPAAAAASPVVTTVVKKS